MDVGIPSIEMKNLTESKPRKSRFLVCGFSPRKASASARPPSLAAPVRRPRRGRTYEARALFLGLAAAPLGAARLPAERACLNLGAGLKSWLDA